MEEEKEGMSFMDVCKTIFSQKWLAVIIALAITFLGTVFLYWVYSPLKTDYNLTFSINFPGSDAASPVYPDNTPFNYRDLVSRKNLNEVKAGNEEFADIDVDELYSKNRISITREDTAISGEKPDITYTISVKAKAFDDAKQAEAFIDALAQKPISYINGLAIGQDVYLTDYDSEKFYEDKCELLTKQADYISDEIASLSSKTGGELKNKCISLSIKLDQYKNNLQSAIGTMRDRHYVHNVEETQTVYSARLSAMKTELKNKQRELELIYGQTGGNLSADLPNIDRVVTLAGEISNLENEIKVYEDYLSPEANPALSENEEFAGTLSGLYSTINTLTETYEQYLGDYYASSSIVSYESAIKAEGGMGLLLSLAVSLLVGIIIAAVVAFIVGYNKSKKAACAETSHAEAATPAETPAEEVAPQNDAEQTPPDGKKE